VISKKLLWITILALTLAALGNDVFISNLPYEDIPHRIEAEQMALYYSGELRPPEALTRIISHELFLIRDRWQNSIPDVKMKFLIPWSADHMQIAFHDTIYFSILDSMNPAWDGLCSRLSVEYYKYPYSTDLTWMGVKSETRFNPLKFGQSFIDFPGINDVKSVRTRNHDGPHIVRFDDDNKIKYFFRAMCMPYVNFTYYYFTVDDDSAYFMGMHAECHSAYDSVGEVIPIESLYPYLKAYEDSLEQARPAWVDIARDQIYQLEHAEQYSWSSSE
jgi:hypothetical protein